MVTTTVAYIAQCTKIKAVVLVGFGGNTSTEFCINLNHFNVLAFV
jgi:hypothetical protein